METVSAKEVDTEKATEVGAGNSDEAAMEMQEKDIVETTPTGFGATKMEAGPEVEVVKFAMKNYCFIRDTFFNDL